MPYSKAIVKIINIKYKNLINIKKKKKKPYILSYLNKKLRDFYEHYIPRA